MMALDTGMLAVSSVDHAGGTLVQDARGTMYVFPRRYVDDGATRYEYAVFPDVDSDDGYCVDLATGVPTCECKSGQYGFHNVRQGLGFCRHVHAALDVFLAH